jgi:signal transduction histidine kinase
MQPSVSSAPRWYHSLYWRIAIGTIALIAVMLVAEGALFLWLSGRTTSMPARDPRQMARIVATELEDVLEADPRADVEKHLRDQYGHLYRTVVVVMRDGRIAANHDDVEEEVLQDLIAFNDTSRFGPRPQRRFARPDGRRDGPGPRDQSSESELQGRPTPGPRDDRQRPSGERQPSGTTRQPGDRPGPNDTPVLTPQFSRGRRSSPGPYEAIWVGGVPVGRLAVAPGNPPYRRIVRAVGPTMGLVTGGVLLVGGSLVALVVFGPARRRMKQVQAATERLGSGDLTARAPEHGGDEVAALARSFNRMADELGQRAMALESSDKARRQLLADVSHELMTPLTAMRGYIETLGMPELALDTPTRERYMRIVTEETHRLEHIVGDLLDLARLEGGGTTMRRERVKLDDAFERVSDRHEREMTARNINLARVIGPGAEHVLGDPDRLEQALQNLVANALRYTPDDGEISLSSLREGDTVKILVRDSGPGLPPDQLTSIFDRFYKVDVSRKAAGGSGLGLSIVKAIIEQHGGTIVARNDGGAVFEITLPIPA